MKKAVRLFVALAACFFLFSCFSITVNVYFPEKDVKSAFKSLEQQLMKGGAEGAPPAEEAPAPSGEPRKPQSLLRIECGSKPAYAQGAGELSSGLAEKLKNDPSVVAAYREMGERLGFINRLRDQGAAGEGRDGLLVPRAALGKKESAAVSEENNNRGTIIRAMAKAIVEINNQPVNEGTVSQVLDKAAAQFAAVRRDSAKPGWWIQKEDGSWAQK